MNAENILIILYLIISLSNCTHSDQSVQTIFYYTALMIYQQPNLNVDSKYNVLKFNIATI